MEKVVLQESYVTHLRRRTITRFMDICILRELEQETSISCYDAMLLIHKKFGVLISPGTVYSAVYSLERRGLVGCTQNHGRAVYMITEKGKEMLEDLKKAKSELNALWANLF
jgi:DNA-binding PadR family transcriptional regulator